MLFQVTGEIVDGSGQRYLRTSVELSRDEVDQLTNPQNDGGAGGVESQSHSLGGDTDYQCECHAWNNQPTFQKTQSRKVELRLACEYRNR